MDNMENIDIEKAELLSMLSKCWFKYKSIWPFDYESDTFLDYINKAQLFVFNKNNKE